MPTTTNTDKLTADVLAVFATWRHGPALPSIRKTLPAERLPKLAHQSGSTSPAKPITTPSRPALPTAERPATIPIPTAAEPEKLKTFLAALRYRDEFDNVFGEPRLFGPVPSDDEPEKLKTFLAELREREHAERITAPDHRPIAPPVMVPRNRRC